ncbi:MAG: 30S ribosomal protein S16 [Candidatus Woykebacteria bacterium RBG_16_44_10]|uniref:Small ribosomal subunit protein bS16 n=1 Tax=Candidatus Woykebacteria bacterium RBG_16_44_10 TaxID=1802597 RepID=A0A1G1WFB3_9BACT|nr:MAG: 30S ribosomal protein S16 [Candidatus Woykebacteria bacterium RBG_16_44_10]
MVKLRLLRIGAKKQPKFRIVVADERGKRDGRFIEIVGHYDPNSEPAIIQLDKDRYSYWLSVGAQPTKSVTDLAKRYERSH